MVKTGSALVYCAPEETMPAITAQQLAGRLWWVGVARGLTALALGAYTLSQPAVSAATVARAAAAYWIVDGLIILWAAALTAQLTLNRVLFLLRGGVAIVAGLTLFGLPLAMVFGPWQPGQVLLSMIVAGVMLTVSGAQILAAAYDVVICGQVRRRIAGECACAIGIALSAALGVIVAATFVLPALLLARTLGTGTVLGGLGLLVAAARLRTAAKPSALSAYPKP